MNSFEYLDYGIKVQLGLRFEGFAVRDLKLQMAHGLIGLPLANA